MKGLLVAALVSWAPVAYAGPFEVYGQVSGGGGFGRGTASAPSKDFFEIIQGANAGGEVGVEILYLDLFMDHYEFFTDKLRGNWTQFMVGLDASFPMDDDRTTEGTIGVDAGLGVGSIGSTTIFDSNQIPVSRKGAAAELRLQGDRLLGKYVAFGLDLRVGYHYLFDADRPINDPTVDPKSQGMHLFGGIAFKLHWGI